MRFNWGHGIAAVYTVFATATLWFVIFAIGHPAELVSADYYQQSLDYDRHTAAKSRAAELGDRVRVTVDAAGAITIQIPEAKPDTVSGRAMLYRPSSAGLDRTFPVSVDETGQQTFHTSGMPGGRWLFQLEWQSNGLAFYAERPVTLR